MGISMRGTLKLNNNIYNIKESNDTRLYIFESDINEDTITISPIKIYFNFSFILSILIFIPNKLRKFKRL